MSEIEHWTGSLKPIKMSEELILWKDQVEYLIGLGFYFDDLCWDEKYFNAEDSDCYYYNGRWYEIKAEGINGEDNIFRAVDGHGCIDFTLRFHNGGCCFSEALDEALKNLEDNDD